MHKAAIIIVAALVIAFGGLMAWSVSSRENLSVIIAADNRNGQIDEHVKGKTDSDIILIEYGDFSCSICRDMQLVMNRLSDDYGDRVAFVFRNFLLGGKYENSKAAAAAAEAAGKQGLYSEMADKLYVNQAVWVHAEAADRDATFLNIYRSVGGEDTERFLADMNSESVSLKIEFDTKNGQRQGVNGTPFFLYDGKKLQKEDVRTEEALRAFLDKILAAKGFPTGAYPGDINKG